MPTQVETLCVSEQMLKRVSYHWFWGLYLIDESESQLTLQSNVEALRSQPEKLARIISKQAQIDHYHPVVRYFFWLFNSSNYASDSYTLSAYKALQRYEGQRSHHQLVNEPDVLWESLKYCLSWANRRLYQLFSQEIEQEVIRDPTPKKARAEMPENPVTRVQPLPASFKVTQAMLAHFLVLEQNFVVGHELSMEQFNAICRAKFLETHPDKGGDREIFIKVKRAKESIASLLQGKDAEHTNEAYYQEKYGELWEKIVKLHRDGMAWEKAIEYAMKEAICEVLAETLAILRDTNAMMHEELPHLKGWLNRLVTAVANAGLMPQADRTLVPPSTDAPSTTVHPATIGRPGFFSGRDVAAADTPAAGAGVGALPPAAGAGGRR